MRNVTRDTSPSKIAPNTKRVTESNHLWYQRGDLEASERVFSTSDQVID